MSVPDLEVLAIRAKQAAQVLRDLKDAVRELPADQQRNCFGHLHSAWLLCAVSADELADEVKWQAKKQQPAAAGGAA